MTIDELAVKLRVPPERVEELVQRGLPHRRDEEGVRQFSPGLVRDWLLEQGLAQPAARKTYVSSMVEVAKQLGVTTKSVQNWKAAGMPYEDLGGAGERFDVAAIKEWREANKGASHQQAELQERGAIQTKLDAVKLKTAEVEYAELIGKLIPVDGPKRVLVQVVHAMRTHLEQFPERLMELVNLPNEAKLEVRRACKVGIEDLLRGIQQQIKDAGDELVTPSENAE